MDGRPAKQQSAIEFITTYGWAIVAIAVVIGILFSLGVFNMGQNGGVGCLAIGGFSCTKPVLSSTGTLTMQFGDIGPTKTITAVGCSANEAQPTFWKSTYVELQSSQIVNLKLNCPAPQPEVLGSEFTGTIWIKYITPGSGGSASTQMVGAIKVPVTVQSGGPFMYVGTTMGIYVINISNYNSIATSACGTCGIPNLAISADGGTVYTSDYNTGKFYSVNTLTNTTTNTITISGINPNGPAVSPSGSLIYLVNNYGGSTAVYVINSTTNTVVQQIGGGPAYYGTFSPTGGDFYYTTSSYINDYNTTTGITATIPNPGAINVAEGSVLVNPSGTLLYFTERSGGSVAVVQTSNFVAGVKRTISVGSNPQGMALSPNGAYLFVVNSGTGGGFGSVSVINTTTNSTVGSQIQTSITSISAIVDPTGRYLYVANLGDSSISVISLTNYQVIKSISLVPNIIPGATPYSFVFKP